MSIKEHQGVFMTDLRKFSWHTLSAFILSLIFCLLQPASAQIAESLIATTPETAPTFPNRSAIAERFVAEGKMDLDLLKFQDLYYFRVSIFAP